MRWLGALTYTKGFTLIEVVLVIVVIGIVSTIAMKSLQPSIEQTRERATIQEMELLAEAIVGDNDLLAEGMRADYGYVGDIGALPPNLDALSTNPGGYSTWNGPYIQGDFADNPDDYKNDAWEQSYSYSGGVILVSNGSGSSITKNLASSVNDLTANSVQGNIYDGLGNNPGSEASNVSVTIYYPDGTGGITSRTTNPTSGGQFFFNNTIPIGNHLMRATTTSSIDTTAMYVSVAPRSIIYSEMRFQGALWGGSGDVEGGLIGHWKLDETSGNMAYDSSGLNNHGTLTNMDVSTCWTTGKIDGGLQFDGTDDKVIILDEDIFDNTGEFTISVWAFPTTLDNRPRAPISKRRNFNNNNSYGVFFYTGDRLNIDVVYNNNRFASNTVFGENQWYHLAIVFDGSLPSSDRVVLYVDGSQDRTSYEANSFMPNYSSDLVIGQLNGNSSGYFLGIIDDVRLYNRALNASEVQILHAMGN